MKMGRLTHLRLFLRSALTAVTLFVVTTATVYAVEVEQANSDLNANADLGQVIGGIINVFLGLLGVIALGLVIYGGYLWMTAAGNEEKIDKAKKILRNAVIGLVIILLSAAIANFILNRLFEETGVNTNNGSSANCTGCSIPGTTSSNFYVLSTNPESGQTDVPLCTDITVRLSEMVDQESITPDTWYVTVQNGAPAGTDCGQNNECASGVCSENLCVGDRLSGDIGFGPGESTSYFNFIPSADLESNTTYEAVVVGGADGILSEDPNPDDAIEEQLAMVDDYTFTFSTGTTTDDIPPQVTENGSSPFPADEDVDVCTNTVINYDFSEPMRITSFNEDTSFVLDEANAGIPDWSDPQELRGWGFGADFDYVQVRPANQLADNTEYGVRLYGGDPNENFSGAITDSCGNALDGDADGTSEGDTVDNYIGHDAAAGEAENPLTWTTGDNAECTPLIENVTTTSSPYYGEYAGAREGETCTQNTDCASGTCTAGECVGYGPTSVRIRGNYLGPHPEVEFQGSILWAGEGINSCFDENHFGNVAGNTSIGDQCLDEDIQTITEINTRVPVGAGDSNVSVTVADETSEPATEAVEPLSPHITGLSPDDGAVGQYVTIVGEHFGSQVGSVVLRSLDGTRQSTMALPTECGDTWTADEVVAIAPESWTNPADGTTGTWETGDVAYIQLISSDGKYSDSELFTYSDTVRPNLCSIEPSCDETAGNPFTVTGDGFSDSQGDNQVVFTSSTDSANGFYASVGSWADTQVSGTTDSAMDQDDYWVSVYDAEAGESSNVRSFDIPCHDGPEVVSLSTCDATNDQYPVPNPRPDTTDACVNTMVGVLFDQELEPSSISNTSVLVQQYNTGAEFNSSYTPLTVVGNFGNSGGNGGNREWTVVDGAQTYYGFQFDVDATSIDNDQDGVADGTSSSLQPNTWYQVTVTDSITNTQGVGMEDAYVYRFKTRNSSDFCEADSINVAPSSATVNDYMTDAGDVENQLYVASAYDQQCSLLDGAGNWGWAIADRAIGSFGANGAGTTHQERIYAVGDDESNEGTTDVTADLSGVDDTAQFEVDLSFCSSDLDCASCSNDTQTSSCNLETNRCTPVIQNFSPSSGDNGTWVTVNGCMFGSRKGSASFNQNGTAVETVWPDEALCGDTWTNDQIILEVPGDETLSEGDYTLGIETQYGDTTESTTPYTVNTETHVGLCLVDPSSANEADDVSSYGQSFGTEQGTAVFRGDDDYDGDADVSVPAESAVTTWGESQVDTQVPQGAVTDEDQGYRIATAGANTNCSQDGECSNPLGFEVSCNRDSECGSGCCSDAGACMPAEYCSSCETDIDCAGGSGEACEGSSCQDGQCTPVITSLAGSSGPTGGPITVQGCYFGSYDANTSAVSFTGEDGTTTNGALLCTDGWSNSQIMVEVPESEQFTVGADLSVGVTTSSAFTTATPATFNVTAECASGAIVPDQGVPLLCDLDPPAGQASSSDGTATGDEIDFEGDHFVEDQTENLFSDGNPASYDGMIGDAYQFISSTASAAEVPHNAQSGNVWVEVQECSGNGLYFAVECTNADDCAEGQYCFDGECAASSCGCTPSDASAEVAACGTGNGCYYDTAGADYCCGARPTFESSNPEDAASDVCPNSIIELEFSEPMQYVTTNDISLNVLNSDGTVGNAVSFVLSINNETIEVIPDAQLDTGTVYQLVIHSNTDDETGITSQSTGLALAGSEQTIEFTTANNACVPDSVTIVDSAGDSDTHTFTASGSTDNFTATVYASDGTQIQSTDTIGWNFSWSPYQDEETSCDDIAWVQLDGETTDTTQSDATSDTQTIESGQESDQQASIEVTVTQTEGSTWQDDRGSSIQDDITVSTFFCEEDLIREYIDSSDSDSFVSHTFPQHFAIRYCQDESDGLPNISEPVVVEVSEDDGKFLEYLFLDQDDQEQAFAIWVYSNDEKLTASEWYQQHAPSPNDSVASIEVDGYEAVQDGTSYYISASNIDGNDLYSNIYLITFNNDDSTLALADEIIENIRFNFDNVNYAECEASDAQKLRRDTKRVTALNTIAFLANEYYEQNDEFPLPESGSLGSYIEGITNSVWPSWAALGNQLGQSLPTDPWNFFDAQADDTPWENQNLTQPWVYEGEDSTLADADCERDEASGAYYDQDGGTCYDEVNQSFRCPANSHVYLYKRNLDDGDDAALYAHLEYESSDTEEYRTTNGTLNPCNGSAECECFNYGIQSTTGNSNDQWDPVNS